MAKATAKSVNKMEAMRQALRELGYDAKPTQLQEYLKAEHGINMDKTVISSYKNTLAKKAASQSAIIRQPGKRAAAPIANSGISLEDIRAVKELADRLGADKVQKLAEVLGK
jgi:hypothetical protein